MAYESVDIFKTPLDGATLKALLAKLGLAARELLRTKDPAYEQLGLASEKKTDAQLIAAMAAHPGLIQRPIVARGGRAVVARPVEKAREILN